MAQMGPILPPKTKLFPRRENIETFKIGARKGPFGPFWAQNHHCCMHPVIITIIILFFFNI